MEVIFARVIKLPYKDYNLTNITTVGPAKQTRWLQIMTVHVMFMNMHACTQNTHLLISCPASCLQHDVETSKACYRNAEKSRNTHDSHTERMKIKGTTAVSMYT